MKKTILILVAAGMSLAGCATYRPSEAECFQFVAGDGPCTFEPLADEVMAGSAYA